MGAWICEKIAARRALPMEGMITKERNMDIKLSSAAVTDIQKLLPGRVRCNVSLRDLSRWKIGGQADVLVSPQNKHELAKLRAWIHQHSLPSVVIGSTSNLLFSDEGLHAIAIHITPDFNGIRVQGQEITAAAGTWVPKLARAAMLAGLTGIEHTCGIPGTLGGLIYMNGGSQRKGIGDAIVTVESIDHSGNIIVRNSDECGFSYRSSVYQQNQEIISAATLKLVAAQNKAECRRAILNILRERRGKFPQKLPNCGSVFVSDPAMYAAYGPPGKIIEDAGFKGFRVGDAVISERHANFIVNTGDAKATDVLNIIRSVKLSVFERTGYTMAVEARYVLPSGEIVSL